MIAVARDHLSQLLQGVLHDIAVWFGAHLGKRIVAPGRNFALHKDAVLVTVVEDLLS